VSILLRTQLNEARIKEVVKDIQLAVARQGLRVPILAAGLSTFRPQIRPQKSRILPAISCLVIPASSCVVGEGMDHIFMLKLQN
jgi:hypothetical protein